MLALRRSARYGAKCAALPAAVCIFLSKFTLRLGGNVSYTFELSTSLIFTSAPCVRRARCSFQLFPSRPCFFLQQNTQCRTLRSSQQHTRRLILRKYQRDELAHAIF